MFSRISVLTASGRFCVWFCVWACVWTCSWVWACVCVWAADENAGSSVNEAAVVEAGAEADGTAEAKETTVEVEEPTLVGGLTMPSVLDNRLPRNAEISPVEKRGLENPLQRTKYLWANSWLFMPVPRLDEDGKILEENDATAAIPADQRIAQFLKIEEWYGAQPPALAGKYVLIEFSASWCPACRRDILNLNHWFEKFGKELVVISVYETDRQSIDNLPGALKGKDLKYFVGIDTKRRTATAMGVFGIPHAVLLEPQYGGVVWEGMPNQPKYELTDEMIEKILSVGRKQKQPQ